MPLKPAYKTLEGQSTAGIILACVPILGYLAGIDFDASDTDKIMQAATTVKDLAEAYKLTQNSPAEIAGMGKFGATLYFIYKVLTRYIDKRTLLKTTALEQKP